ncbi:MAG TPA: hypothetical protein VOA41_03265 [Candidatus Dormibacteraeota bacterium]|nr:hypothetical protein [Candidatus Dormibacteraeota bacterium]
MAISSRRVFIKTGAALAAMPGIVAGARVTAPSYSTSQSNRQEFEKLSSSKAPWKPVRVLDTDRMPWVKAPTTDPEKYAAARKVLFENPETKGALVLTFRAAGWGGAPVHYHTFHEWGYMLSGDSTNNESTHPKQHYGPLMRFREGYYLDRPPYSLHGGERGRQDFMRSQSGASWFFMEEQDVWSGTYSVEPQVSYYNPDYKKVKQWTVPRIIDTIGGMPFEPDPDVPGLHFKYLTFDQTTGFRVMLYRLEPEWNSSRSPQFARAYYYKQGYQFTFVLAGDLNIQTYQAPGQKAEKITLGRYSYVERAPMSIFGLADGVVTQIGCYWLEATYGKGATHSSTPIEDPNYI